MKRLIMIVGLLLVVLLLVPVSCAKAPPPAPEIKITVPAPVPRPASAPAPSIKISPPSPAPPREEAAYEGDERMIVRTGEISLVVKDVADVQDEIARLAVRFDGYVVSSQISGEEQEMRGWISIRVPDDKFEQALAELRELAVRVKSESTNSQDVTEQYVDLKSRLKNAEATESQYLALLERAEVEETIRIYELLHQVRREIEQTKGQMQYLERTSSMSLISVRFQPEATTKPLVRAGWSALETLKSAVRGIATFGQWLGTTAIWLLIFSPVWGAILGIIYWRRRRKRA